MTEMFLKRRAWVTLALLITVTGASPATAQNWPQFRGPNGSGIADGNQLPLEWGPGRNVAWSVPIPGRGYSSPIVWGDKVFLTTAIADGELPKSPKGMLPDSKHYTAPDVTLNWHVLCLSLKSGEVLWDKSIKVGKPDQAIHPKNSFATETPATDGRRLYVYLSQVGLLALDFDGQLQWEQHPGTYETSNGWGTGSSAITDGNSVYLQCDNQQSSFVVAYDCATGQEIWRTPREDKSSWGTPLLWRHAQRTELVTVGPTHARAYDARDGAALWWIAGMSSQSVPTPIADDQFCYVASGFIPQKNKPVVAVRPGATGDITPTSDDQPGAHVAWRNNRVAPYVPSPLVYRGRLFILGDGAIVNSLDTLSGKPLYEKKRLPQGGPFTASPCACDGKFYCLTEGGLTYVLEAGEEFKVLAVNPALDEDGLFLATPAIAGNALLIRGAQQLHCIREASPASN